MVNMPRERAARNCHQPERRQKLATRYTAVQQQLTPAQFDLQRKIFSDRTAQQPELG
jgi:hypothetical protein